MSNEYKATLERFEQAVRAHDNRGAQPPGDWHSIDREYEEAKRALVQKLQYRQLAAEQRNHGHLAQRQQDEYYCARCDKRWPVGEEPPLCE